MALTSLTRKIRKLPNHQRRLITKNVIYEPYLYGSTPHPSDPNKEKVLFIVAHSDGVRISCNGGYPSKVAFIEDLVVWADIEHDGEPSLTITTIQRFLENHADILDDLAERVRV